MLPSLLVRATPEVMVGIVALSESSMKLIELLWGLKRENKVVGWIKSMWSWRSSGRP